MITNIKSFMLHSILGLSLLTGQAAADEIQQNLSLSSVNHCFDTDWKYLEFLFIEQPKSAINSAIQKLQAAMLVSLSTFVLGKTYYTTKEIKCDSSALSVSVLGYVGYCWYAGNIEATIKKETLVKFLQNWSFHRSHVPELLIPAFDELAAAYNTAQTISNSQVSEFYAIVQHLIEHEFSKRYEKEKAKSDGSLGIFKTITDVYKNIK